MLPAFCLFLCQETPYPSFLSSSFICFFLLYSALPSLNTASVLFLICKIILLFLLKFLLHNYFIYCKIIKLSRYLTYMYVIGRVVYWQRDWKLYMCMNCISVIILSTSCFYYGLLSCLCMTHEVTWGKAYLFLMPEVLFKSKQKYMWGSYKEKSR